MDRGALRGIQGVWSQQLVGGNCVRWCKCFFCLFVSGNLLPENSWFGEAPPNSLCWCESGGALRKYDAECCCLGRRGLRAGFG